MCAKQHCRFCSSSLDMYAMKWKFGGPSSPPQTLHDSRMWMVPCSGKIWTSSFESIMDSGWSRDWNLDPSYDETNGHLSNECASTFWINRCWKRKLLVICCWKGMDPAIKPILMSLGLGEGGGHRIIVVPLATVILQWWCMGRSWICSYPRWGTCW